MKLKKLLYNTLIIILLTGISRIALGQQTRFLSDPATSFILEDPSSLPDYLDSIAHSGQKNVLLLLKTSEKTNISSLKQAFNLESAYAMGDHLFLTLFVLPNHPGRMPTDITGWGRVEPQDKVSPALWPMLEQNPSSRINLLVSLGGENPQLTLQKILNDHKMSLPVKQPWVKNNIYRISADSTETLQLAGYPFVLYLQPELEPRPLSNSLAVGYTNSEIAHQPTALGGMNLLGDGVTLGIGDDGNPNHIDYIDRLNSFNPNVATGHGTHTTGTMAGGGLKDQRYQGFAPHARIIMDLFNGVIINAPSFYSSFGMSATNNSYAATVGDCNYAGLYDLYAAFLDNQAVTLPKVLNVFAAGNDRTLTCSPLPPGYGTVVGAYSTAKDVLTVANIGLTRQIINNTSSVGPVKDGRLKPEITGMGNNLTSTWTNNNYAVDNGTSMATPNVTGAAGLLVERYKQIHTNQDPDNALVKLLLMNGADDLDIPGPDYKYGFGLLNLGRSLSMVNNNQYFSGALQTGQQSNFTFSVPANQAYVKVMLYWNDPPAQPNAVKALVNDLDLTVTNPNGTLTQPLVLNPQQVTAAATPGADHLNNVEQVVISQPQSGTYTIHVKGYDIPQGNQSFYVAYDLVDEGIAFQYPVGGETLIQGDNNQYIYWQAPDTTQTFSLSYSADNGNTWVVIDDNIAADQRAYKWLIPYLNTAQCILKLVRGGVTVLTQPFSISERPVITPAATAQQCPGSFNFSWSAVSNVTQYQIYKKTGSVMKVVDTVAATSYTLTGLSPDSTYWVAVAPIIGNGIGIRTVAVSYRPNVGNCSSVANHGDLRLIKILSPVSGRDHTQSALTNANDFSVRIQNLDNQTAGNYQIFWRINGGSWNSSNFTNVINANDSLDLTLPPLDLSTPGDYTLSVAVNNVGHQDPVLANDSLTVIIRHLSNDPLDLLTTDYEQNFETLSANPQYIGQQVVGVWGTNRWDFETTTSTGRARSYINDGVNIQGNRSLSMDNQVNQKANINGSAQNYFTGTFNLGNYNVNQQELRLDFDYSFSGVPKFDTGNQVWVRGSEADPWLNLYKYVVDTNNPGALSHASSVSVTDVLKNAGQDFSTSTQIRFCQRDTSLIEARNYGNGLTLDNIVLSLANNDIQLVGIDSVMHFNCALSNQVSLRAKVYNSANSTLSQIPIRYQLDGGAVVSEVIPDIPGKTTIEYVFQQKMDLSASGYHLVSVWTAFPSDNYPQNDSLLDYPIRNQPVIDQFPYLENFENGDGGFYTDGMASSWQYGTPNDNVINHAASGQKAWKTNLSGTYNNNEWSFLYSPCYDISNLQNPTLSFSLISDIENNPDSNSIYDEAYVEYTTDGVTWTLLGAANTGYNWYDNPVAEAWTTQGKTWWHVATTPLPQVQGTIAFRIVLKTDPGASYEGVAVDDIHIYDLQNPIYFGDSLTTPLTQSVGTNQKRDFVQGNKLLAEVENPGVPITNLSVQFYPHADFVNPDSSQYFLPENFVIQTQTQLSDSVLVSVFVTDSAMAAVRNAVVCPSCVPVDEIYKMGVSYYSDPNLSHENNLLSDNEGGEWTFIPRSEITYVPYDIGYKATFKVGHFSEFWFNSGGPDNNTPLPITLFDFEAEHYGPRGARLSWKSGVDENTFRYHVQRADDSNLQFQTIGELAAVGKDDHTYVFIDTPELAHPYVLYRIQYDYMDGKTYNSPIRRLDWSSSAGQVYVYPNPVRSGNILNIRWFKGNSNPLRWRLVDNQGRYLNSGTLAGNPYNDTQTMSLDQLGIAAGVYILQVYSGSESWSFSIVYQP